MSEMIGHVEFCDTEKRITVSAHMLPKDMPILVSVTSGYTNVGIHLSRGGALELAKTIEEMVAVLDAKQEGL